MSDVENLKNIKVFDNLNKAELKSIAAICKEHMKVYFRILSLEVWMVIERWGLVVPTPYI